MIRTLALAAAASVALPAIAAAEPVTLKFDPNHSSVRAEWSHTAHTPLLIAFPKFDGTVVFDEANVENSTVTMTVDTASLWTGVPLWEEHLADPERPLLATATYPQATFTSTAVEKTGDNTGKVTGDLTIKDQTHPVTFDVEFTRMAEGMRGPVYGFLAKGVIQRAEFGVPMAVEDMGGDVTITVAAEMAPAE